MVTKDQLKNIPPSPGVYLMKDRHGRVIYIGKAVQLRNRVRSYFRESGDTRYTIYYILSKVEDIECLVTSTEKEALILENNLIKKYKPRYNIRLKDDKTYFSLKIDINHTFPKLSLVRKIKKDGALYFGPFASSVAAKATIRMIRRLFPVRSCSEANFMNKSRPCLNYQLQRCTGPCCGYISEEQYREMIHRITLLLQGKDKTLLKVLEGKMERASTEMRFEEAAELRDKIHALKETLDEQKVVSQHYIDQDILSFYREGSVVDIAVLYIRGGKLLGSHSFSFKGNELPAAQLLSSFIAQYYQGDKFIPSEIIIPATIEDQELLQDWLTEKKGTQVTIIRPLRGVRMRLVHMASQNAEASFKQREESKEDTQHLLEAMKAVLHLGRIPYRIECFDVSNIQGRTAVASMVVFEHGSPASSRYRKYRVKTVDYPDDYAMMYEVLMRRYTRAVQEDDIPDLIMVDGGKGQLNVALSVRKALGMEVMVDVVSLAKAKRVAGEAGVHDHKKPGDEKVYIPHRKNPLVLRSHPQVLLLLQRIRDEAHRFAISYHKSQRKKAMLHSRLEEIPGVGPVVRKRLLETFPSVEAIRKASLGELCTVQGVSRALAERIHKFLS